jgi:hypothetical protein
MTEHQQGYSSYTSAGIIRPGRARVRTTYQLAADIVPGAGQTVDDLQARAREITLDWIQGKWPSALPDRALAGETFELDEPGQRLLGVALPDEGAYALRLEQPDAPMGGHPGVPGRTWTTDIAFARGERAAAFGVRVQCNSMEYADRPITLTRPRVVPDLAQALEMRQVRQMNGQPQQLESFNDLLELEAFLLDSRRALPVYMLTEADPQRYDFEVDPFLLDPQWLADRLVGLGWVVCLPQRLSRHWTDLVGKPWTAFRGAVRGYMPGMEYDSDSPYTHPLTVSDKIVRWRYEDDRGTHTGERAFERFLRAKAREHAASKRVDWAHVLFAPQARARRAAGARSRTQNLQELAQLFEEENHQLKTEIEGLKDERDASLEMADQIEQERDYYRAEWAKLRARNGALRLALEARGDRETDDIDAFSGDWSDLAAWVDDHLAGRLVLHPRAQRAAKDAEYEDPQLAAQALNALAREYRNMRLGMEGAPEAWDRKIKSLHLEHGRSMSDSRRGQHGDEYEVVYPPHSDEKHVLELHLKKGVSHEPRHCLRIYFFWHEDEEQVVVGWLPTHLSTRSG